MELKVCPKCGRSFPATTEFFYSDPCSKRDGLYSWCKKCAAARDHVRYVLHQEEKIARSRAYRETHKKQGAAYAHAWRQRNPERVAEYLCRRYEADPQFYLSLRLASGISKSLRDHRPGRAWEGIAGYTVGDLMRRLEAQFQPGMTWDNYGKWQIDHIRPRSSFSFTSVSDPQFKECWALSNLQPLWAEDNRRKGIKVDGEAAQIPAL